MRCAESGRVQAHFDGELDAVASRNLGQHIVYCNECSELLRGFGDTKAMLQRALPQIRTPPDLQARIQRVLDSEEKSSGAHRTVPRRPLWQLPQFWWGSLSGAGAVVIAGALALFVLTLPFANPVVDAVLHAHLNALTSAHLIDVVSTDKHTVKPWFAGRADVSPAVADFTPQGYKLYGGRVDNLEHQRAAVIVYQHGPHVIEVYCWIAPHGPLPRATTRRGYHMAFWRNGDLAYAAVSDTGWDELFGLEDLLRRLGTTQVPPDPPSGKSSPTGE